MRWPHALFGMINPERFVGLAEQCGLIGELDDWVMRRACRDVCRLHGQGLELRVGVNCSALNLSDPELPARVDNALRSSCLPAAYLTIEITENALMGNLLQAADSLQKIRELGVRVSIDDFGTGYSSLAYLRRLPVNTLKIDRSFVRELDTNQQDQELTGAIIAMAHKLQLRVVAEGVESLKHVSLLRSQQCDLLQGFWFSKPLPVADLLEWLSLYRPIDVLPPQAQQQVS
ncbi:EAL domain-containing protein [Atopomonas sediminilitoris]|uniref:EAL domain-containing protein n=1 Tax=Atopomonas sediminilitoris TaxID=2919919 RepID=UPI001F4D8BA9|nr:EAL domain-containing protein [Atopomonas sediminilitoris]